MTTLGKKIQMLRKEKGWTQEELASRIGVSAQAVSKWETDISSPDISLIAPLAKLFEVSTDELLSTEDSSPTVRMVEPANRKKAEELIFHIRVDSVGGDKVRVNLPLPLIKIALQSGLEINGKGSEILNQVNIEQVIQLAEQGVLGTLVEITSASGDRVEIVVE